MEIKPSLSSPSKGAIKAIGAFEVTFRLVWDCIKYLNILREIITPARVPGYDGTKAMADKLANKVCCLCGDLGNSASKQEIEDAFRYYGPLRNVWVARNPPGFAFVEFEDPRDAEDAVRGLDGRRICGRKARVERYGRTICGRRARVEMSNGKSGRYRGPPPRSVDDLFIRMIDVMNAAIGALCKRL
ncbi:hypothetical protein NQ317_002636 [Molorchus minor]|uniref:RRM domain-containing protein n=1 Tax=Molorchus minor TaxID=1323400 RepID=A0ABQ9IYP7_9CUCU|nr:hypothetical protein NQ317_002636 [Molorchus minor]